LESGKNKSYDEMKKKTIVDYCVILKGYKINSETRAFLEILNFPYELKGTRLWIKVDVDAVPDFTRINEIIEKLDS
jgi:hypothetical protein